MPPYEAWLAWRFGASTRLNVILSLLFAIGASNSAMNLLNSLVSLFIRPYRLPQMNFNKGIPDEARVIVAVPTMLTASKNIPGLLEGIEIRYLANRERNVYFALLTDFADADKEVFPDDAELLKLAEQGVAELNKKYASDRSEIFFLLHRPRRAGTPVKACGWATNASAAN